MKKFTNWLVVFLCTAFLTVISGCKPEAVPVTLQSIEITSPAEKTEYFVGEELDTTGLEVTAYYSNGTSKIVEDWTTEGFDSSAASDELEIKVLFQSKETGYTVKIIAVTLSEIEITKPASKTEYCINQELDTAGLEVTATKNDGSKEIITGYTAEFDSSKTGDTVAVKVKYQGKETSFNVKVTDHSYGGWNSSNGTRTCSRCGNVENCVHSEDRGTVTMEPTCTKKGEITYKCTGCGAVLRTEEIAAKGHTEGSDTEITKEPTCVTKGSKAYTCTGCGKVVSEEIPELYSSPVDAETGAAATASSTYIYFGVFPKSVAYKDDSGKLYAADKTTEITIDENNCVTMGGNTYYKGSDGEYYAKVTENAYESGYKYNDGTTVNQSRANSTRYFRVEPIKWKVLTTGYDIDGTSGSKTGALLLAEDILTGNVPYYYSYSGKRSVGTDTTIYPNNYKYSQIRAYLNGLDYYNNSNIPVSAYSSKGFLQTAFTEDAQSLINTTTVDNSKETTGYSSSTYASSYACADTEDKIFLLSESEVINTAYGFASYSSNGTGNARIRKTTDYAKANYACQNTTAGYGGWWWLRSPGCSFSSYARYVNCFGDADCLNYVDDAHYGLVPALSISF